MCLVDYSSSAAGNPCHREPLVARSDECSCTANLVGVLHKKATCNEICGIEALPFTDATECEIAAALYSEEGRVGNW